MNLAISAVTQHSGTILFVKNFDEFHHLVGINLQN